MTTNDLIDSSINDVLNNCPKRHKEYISNLSIVELIELFESLVNSCDLAVYDMVIKGEMIALPYIGRLKIKEGTKNAQLVYNQLFEKYKVNSLDDISDELKEQIKLEFEELYKVHLKTKSDIQRKEELMAKINKNLAKSLFNT